MSAYYLHFENQVQGPYSEAEVRARFDTGYLQPDTQICISGGQWARLADTLPSLFPPPAPLVSASCSTASITPPVASSSPPEAATAVTSEGIGRLGFLIWIIGIAVLVGILKEDSWGSGFTALLSIGLVLIPASLRLRNIGRNPRLCFLLLVPIIGLLVTIPCLVLPADYQKHRKLDLPAKIIGGGLLVLSIGLIILGFTQM
jgi:uncharacterized membrane protein YhaH (DUF805 family)